jgi:DNA-binding CsgD family transcriptional regulator
MGGSDAAGARTAYLDALGAAIFAARLAPAGGTVADVARAALCAPGADAAGTPDLLDGLAACFGERQSAGTPVLQRALAGFGRGMPAEQELRWLPLASAGALRLWDDQAWEALALRHVRLAREAGALSDLPLALTSLACLRLQAGDLATAESLAAEAQLTASATDGWLFPYGTVSLAAVRGRQAAALALLDSAGQDALLHGEGLGIAAVKWATALLHNGLGQYGKALSAAGEAIWYAGQSAVAGWARTELIEAAARAGQPGRAVEAMRQLAQATTAAGTDWALGIRSRSQALLSDGDLADELYRAAIKHLGQSSAGLDLGRAHLLYGEWLRRESRRVDAREQLRRGNEILGAMGADGFAERARRELLATGETARKRTVQTDRDLTAQELEIAVRARGGMTNTEIGAELFVSPRTVEWHLRKVFVKLGITSRRQLQHALPAAAMCDC